MFGDSKIPQAVEWAGLSNFPAMIISELAGISMSMYSVAHWLGISWPLQGNLLVSNVHHALSKVNSTSMGFQEIQA